MMQPPKWLVSHGFQGKPLWAVKSISGSHSFVQGVRSTSATHGTCTYGTATLSTARYGWTSQYLTGSRTSMCWRLRPVPAPSPNAPPRGELPKYRTGTCTYVNVLASTTNSYSPLFPPSLPSMHLTLYFRPLLAALTRGFFPVFIRVAGMLLFLQVHKSIHKAQRCCQGQIGIYWFFRPSVEEMQFKMDASET